MYKDPSDLAPRNRRAAVLPRKLLAATALAACLRNGQPADDEAGADRPDR